MADSVNIIDRIQVSKTECHVKVELLINQTLIPNSKNCVSKSEEEQTKIRVERDKSDIRTIKVG